MMLEKRCFMLTSINNPIETFTLLYDLGAKKGFFESFLWFHFFIQVLLESLIWGTLANYMCF